MKRVHWFEFTDLTWFPCILRQMMVDLMQFAMVKFCSYEPRLDLIVRAIKASKVSAYGQFNIVDLCSGGGGPWLKLSKQLEQRIGGVRVILTDKYPESLVSLERAFPKIVSRHGNSVDALAIPDQLNGVRVLFNSFHHFKPEEARAILGDAIRHGQPIIIFECLKRDWRSVFSTMLIPVLVCCFTPFVKPFRFSRLLFTYVIPLVPLAFSWDALVSILRCYSPDELLSMARGCKGAEEYVWEAGIYQLLVGYTYLVGYPKEDGFAG